MERPLVDENGLMRYHASKFDCDPCALKQRCGPNTPARKILRSIHEGARDMARDIAATGEYVVSRRQREKVEMLSAHLKRILKLDRLRPQGPRSPRRVPPRSRRSEPQEARQIGRQQTATQSRVTRDGRRRRRNLTISVANERPSSTTSAKSGHGNAVHDGSHGRVPTVVVH